MEPMLIRDALRARSELVDMAVDLASKSAALRSGLPPRVVDSLAGIVRTMNCYYSNLIEGHDTHPVDIERALAREYTEDPRRRHLQIEARAHIEVQRWIDEGGLGEPAPTTGGLLEIHRRFYELMPEELLLAVNPNTGERIPVVGGELRRRDVIVGSHVAVSPGAVPRFLERFGAVYAPLGRADQVIAAATAHHRLLWIHPFLDGNGRVARLMSHGVLGAALDSAGLWSICRGLARREAEYKRLLAECDLRRRHDADGRGNLSEEALLAFTRFFLAVCCDQAEFMARLIEPDGLRRRILDWVAEEMHAGRLPRLADRVMGAVLERGELPRRDVGVLLGVSERHARRVSAALLDRRLLVTGGARSPLQIAFPAALLDRWLPGLYAGEARSSDF